MGDTDCSTLLMYSLKENRRSSYLCVIHLSFAIVLDCTVPLIDMFKDPQRKIKIQSLSPHRHVDGKTGQVS